MANLIASTRSEIAELLGPHLDRQYRAVQVASWIHDRHCQSFEEMSNLPLALRRQLGEAFSLREPSVLRQLPSADGSTKYLLRFDDDTVVEAVAMPSESKVTLCLSAQTGCPLGCSFCVTGQLGAGRNLTAEEMVGQYRVMLRNHPRETRRVNVVFMGMGEPLLNTHELGRAVAALFETISPRRVTVSTAGVVPGIRWLGALGRRPKLAVSLNAPDQERRQSLMPIAARYPLDELMAELRRFPLERGRRVTFEYILIDSFNDAVADARAVAALLSGIPCKVNVIPLNPDPSLPAALQPPSVRVTDEFVATLRARGLTATIRRSRGQDVSGACGQLRSVATVGPPDRAGTLA